VPTSKTIPSILNSTTSTTAETGRYLYITSILKSTSLSIDSSTASNVGPITFSSPIRCRTFSSTGSSEVAYYQSN
jgi:hypothetical protein